MAQIFYNFVNPIKNYTQLRKDWGPRVNPPSPSKHQWLLRKSAFEFVAGLPRHEILQEKE